MKPRVVTVRYQRVLPYPVPVAYAWLTDYRDDDPERTHAIHRSRHVISRSETDVLLDAELEFAGRPLKVRVAVKLDPPSDYTATFVAGPLKGSVYHYRVTAVPSGCRLDIEHNFRVARVKNWVRLLFARPKLRREIASMWDGFAAAMAREITPPPLDAVAP